MFKNGSKKLKRKLKKSRKAGDKIKSQINPLETLENLKGNYNSICHPSSYTPQQKIVANIIEFVYRDTKVIYSSDDENKKQALIYYTDTKKSGAYMKGTYPEDNWNGIAEALLMQELDANILPFISRKSVNLSENFYDTLNKYLEEANKYFKFEGFLSREKME